MQVGADGKQRSSSSSDSAAVPHGGYVTACFQKVVRAHFDSTLHKQNQPHTITLHLDFLRRTQVGPAIFKVKDVKLGRQTSIVHVTLLQDEREEVVGYITNSNINTEKGPTFPTHFALHPPPYGADVLQLAQDRDANWAERKEMPFASFRKASQHVRFFFPREGQLEQSLRDQWMCFRNGEKFTNESLGFVADVFPQVIESYRTGGEDPYSIELERKMSQKDQEAKEKGRAKFWYPTLLLNLDVKKALPEEGVEWLFLRTRTKQIKNGRYDLEVIVMDESGEIVVLSHHVCLVLGTERNMAKRAKSSEESKL